MSVLRAALLVAALAAPAAAPTATFAAESGGASVALTLADALISRRPILVQEDAEASDSAAQKYFEYDALLTLGALALAGGGLAAWGRSRMRQSRTLYKGGPARWMQEDLAERVARPRDAA